MDELEETATKWKWLLRAVIVLNIGLLTFAMTRAAISVDAALEDAGVGSCNCHCEP